MVSGTVAAFTVATAVLPGPGPWWARTLWWLAVGGALFMWLPHAIGRPASSDVQQREADRKAEGNGQP